MKVKIKVVLLVLVVLGVVTYLLTPLELYKCFEQEDFIYIEINSSDKDCNMKSYSLKVQKETKEYQEIMEVIKKIYYHRAWNTRFSNTINYGSTSVTLYTKSGIIFFTDSGEMLIYGDKYIAWNKSNTIIRQLWEILAEYNE